MNESLIQSWNHVVTKPNQRVFCFGDFAFGSPNFIKRILARLNGYKILVKGNHDRGRNKMVSFGFQEAYSTITGTWNDKTIFGSHIPLRDRAAKFDIHFCGHVHEKWCKVGNIINVGIDVWDLKPQPLKFIVENAERVQRGLAQQLTFDESWEDRNNGLIESMYRRPETDESPSLEVARRKRD